MLFLHDYDPRAWRRLENHACYALGKEEFFETARKRIKSPRFGRYAQNGQFAPVFV